MRLPYGTRELTIAQQLARNVQRLHVTRQKYAERAAKEFGTHVMTGRQAEFARSGIAAAQGFVFDTLRDRNWCREQLRTYGVSEDHLDYAHSVAVMAFFSDIKAELEARQEEARKNAKRFPAVSSGIGNRVPNVAVVTAAVTKASAGGKAFEQAQKRVLVKPTLVVKSFAALASAQ